MNQNTHKNSKRYKIRIRRDRRRGGEGEEAKFRVKKNKKKLKAFGGASTPGCPLCIRHCLQFYILNLILYGSDFATTLKTNVYSIEFNWLY
jgi:hypothetical protein